MNMQEGVQSIRGIVDGYKKFYEVSLTVIGSNFEASLHFS